MKAVVERVGYLSLWAGLYVTGAVVCFVQTSGLAAKVPVRAAGTVVAFSLCLATAVYLLDRVKLRDAWLDHADAEAHPRRYLFLARRSGGVRLLIVILLTAAVWLAGAHGWAGALTVLAAVAGVLAYAARPRGRHARPKDVLLVKNLYIAGGITGFAVVVGSASAMPDVSFGSVAELAASHGGRFVFAGMLLLVRVFADAVLCDLDDQAADARFGTRTLPGRVGRRRAWDVAMGMRLVLAAVLATAAALPESLHHLPRATLLLWACTTAGSSLLMRRVSPAHVRDWVDIRLAVEAAVVTLALQAFG